ncbi:MAG: recombinase family protein [Ktedonobacteraceae bacterium]|nr:recombinase family protein [Ktedonobacteraceae bacterium]
MVSLNSSTPRAATSFKRAAIYARVSTEMQEEEGTSLLSQVQDCRAYCQAHGYSVSELHVYRDVHTGTEYREREQLTRMREAMRKRAFEVVVVWAVDRLSRAQVHLAVLIDEAQYLGVEIEFVQQQFDNSPVGQFLRNTLGFVGEIEREKIIERTQRGRLARAQAGKPTGGKGLYGYRYLDPEKTAYIVDPQEGKVVKRIFQMVAEGHTIRSIARTLTQEGIPSPSGANYWVHTTILRILENKLYTGEGAVYRYKCIKVQGRRTYRVEMRPEEEQIKLPHGVVPSLVDGEAFLAVQERLQLNKQLATRNNQHPEASLLRGGYAKCGYCGCNLSVERQHHRPKGVTIYRCRNTKGAIRRCVNYSISAEKLDSLVWQRITEVVQDPSLIIKEIEKQKHLDPTKEELCAVERTLAKVKREQKNLLDNLATLDAIYADAIRTQLNKLADEQRKLERERDMLYDNRRDWQELQKKFEEFQAWCSHFAERLGAHSYEEKRLACEVLGVQARVWRKDHTPRYQITMSPKFVVQTVLYKEHLYFRELEVATDNKNALSLYHSCGFRETGNDDYYSLQEM